MAYNKVCGLSYVWFLEKDNTGEIRKYCLIDAL